MAPDKYYGSANLPAGFGGVTFPAGHRKMAMEVLEFVAHCSYGAGRIKKHLRNRVGTIPKSVWAETSAVVYPPNGRHISEVKGWLENNMHNVLEGSSALLFLIMALLVPDLDDFLALDEDALNTLAHAGHSPHAAVAMLVNSVLSLCRTYRTDRYDYSYV